MNQLMYILFYKQNKNANLKCIHGRLKFFLNIYNEMNCTLDIIEYIIHNIIISQIS